jgi:hypothetical protein
MWPPRPAIRTGLGPLAVIVEILGAPNILIEVLVVVSKTLRQITLTIADPFVDGVTRCGGEQVPISSVLAGDDEFRGTSVAQRESGSV